MSLDLKRVTHAFVELMPPKLEPGVMYISIEYKTMVHLCCCGCGKKVVTPLSPTGWQFTYDGKSITISPSVGNWNLECQSHYWIEKSKVYWASQWPDWKISAGFARDGRIKREYFGEADDAMATNGAEAQPPQPATPPEAERAAENDDADNDSTTQASTKQKKRWKW